MNEKFYTVPEVAKLLKVEKAYVYDLINFGKLKAFKLSERRTRISIDELNKYLEGNLCYNKSVRPPIRRNPKYGAA